MIDKAKWYVIVIIFMISFFLPTKQVMAGSRHQAVCTSLGAGYYLPKHDNFSKIYPDEGQIVGFLEISKIWFNHFETAIGIGGLKFSGHTLNADNTKNIDEAELILAPGYLQISYLFRYNQEQKIVPYLGAGLDAWGYQEKRDEDKLDGCKYGYHYLVGFRFLLDWLEPKEADRLSQEDDIENTYLVLEARFNQIDNFGEHKLDLSGPIYRLGILVEF